MSRVRTRFSPSPTGYLNLWGLKTALINYIVAKQNEGNFILRIEDTDQARYVPGSEKYILESLAWLGINPDEGYGIGGNYGPYRQSEKLGIYKKHALALIDSGNAYYAFDTDEELNSKRLEHEKTKKPFAYNAFSRNKMRNSISLSSDEVASLLNSNTPYTIRFKMPLGIEGSFVDGVRGEIKFKSDNLYDAILLKSDGYPSYALAHVVDDTFMEISHVIRAVEWLSSTPLHIMLFDTFGWKRPKYSHLPLVNGPDGQKLSKRKRAEYGFPVFPLGVDTVSIDGDSEHLEGMDEYGIEPKALLNFLILIGWNPGTNQEVFSIEELIQVFSMEKINKSDAIFDIKKLKNLNAYYLHQTDNDSLWRNYMYPFIRGSNYYDKYCKEKQLVILDVAKERSLFGKDIYKAVTYFFEDVVLNDDVALKNHDEFCAIMEKFIPEYNHDLEDKELHDKLVLLCVDSDIKIGKVMPDLRLALTGGLPGPSLTLTMWILGQEKSIQRINNLLSKVKRGLIKDY